MEKNPSSITIKSELPDTVYLKVERLEDESVILTLIPTFIPDKKIAVMMPGDGVALTMSLTKTAMVDTSRIDNALGHLKTIQSEIEATIARFNELKNMKDVQS